MKRFKNYGLWVAVAALIGMILQDAGVSITPEKYDAYVNAILTVLVLAGIVNNPTSGRGFRDEE
jgi:uncharacterized membrane protein